jgi:hypothetical protein
MPINSSWIAHNGVLDKKTKVSISEYALSVMMIAMPK